MFWRVQFRILAFSTILFLQMCFGGTGAIAQQYSRTLAQGAKHAKYADHTAMAHLCRVYFDALNGTFEPAKAAAWCRRSAAAGDARAMHRLALLALAGIGTSKNLGEAAGLCVAAHERDAAVPSGFCLAAVEAERQDTGHARNMSVEPATSMPNNDLAAMMAGWRAEATQGKAIALSNLCSAYFDARNGTFDPVPTASWCRRAAEHGDARAEERIGLMHLWGVGMERSLQQAAALCEEAHARDPKVPAAFCVAAVKQRYDEAAMQASPSAVVYPTPWPGVGSPVTPDPSLLTHVLGPDRVLESIHVTPGGLHYDCRNLTRWARYGLPVGTTAFGRQIAKLTKQDYADLDVAASACAAAIAPYDKDGSERRLLSEFQRLLVPLEARQRSLIASRATRQGEKAKATGQSGE